MILCTQEAAREISTDLAGPPDLIIGNYSDGNLVATLMCQQLGVTQVRTFTSLLDVDEVQSLNH